MKKTHNFLSKSMQSLFEAEQDLARMRRAYPERSQLLLKHPGPVCRVGKIGKRVIYGRALSKPIVSQTAL